MLLPLIGDDAFGAISQAAKYATISRVSRSCSASC